MKRSKSNSGMQLHDYRLALQRAVSWLGDRYVLAEPVVRRAQPSRPFFVEATSWHNSRRLSR